MSDCEEEVFTLLTFAGDELWHMCQDTSPACGAGNGQIGLVRFLSCYQGTALEADSYPFHHIVRHACAGEFHLCPKCVSDILHEGEIAAAATLLASDESIWEGVSS